MATKHEPVFNETLGNSIIFLNTVGMRLSPELLVQELFREVFYDKSSLSSEMQLQPNGIDPDSGKNFFDEKERAVLHAFRGRRKQNAQSKSRDFYAPAYPVLARGGWFRKNSERVVKYQLFAGPLGQYLATQDASSRKKAVTLMLDAFLGNRRATKGQVSNKEFFSAALKNSELEGTYDDWEQRIHDLINGAPRGFISDDDLASRIYYDFISICGLEASIPRLQWLDILMTFLRLALPTWYIAQSRISIMLRNWIVEAIDNDSVIGPSEVHSKLKGRYRGIFHPSEVPTLEANEHVSNYIKARVELNLAIQLLLKADIKGLKDKVISCGNGCSDMVTIDNLLLIAKTNRTSITALLDSDLTLRKALTREGERWNAWKDPLKKGQGKNIDEFLRVLYKSKEGDDSGGYLLSRAPKNQGFYVFPGHQLAKTMVLLAAMERKRVNPGKLLINDVENHFSSYGIEFGVVAGARPRLLSLLSEIGLLKGSPDAGESAEVGIPYTI